MCFEYSKKTYAIKIHFEMNLTLGTIQMIKFSYILVFFVFYPLSSREVKEVISIFLQGYFTLQ